MSNQFEQPNISFRKDTGRETGIKTVSETKIGGGYFGDIFDTIIEIGGHQKRFIIKKYIGRAKEAKEATKKAFENYSTAKKAGLKVFPTFRMSEDEKSILMTSGFLNENVCIGDPETICENIIVEEIENVNKFISSFFAEAVKASLAGIPIASDATFIIASKDKPTKIDFVLGDLDNLRNEDDIKDIWRFNIRNVRDELIRFCNNNISPNYRKKFLDKVEYYYRQSIKKNKDKIKWNIESEE